MPTFSHLGAGHLLQMLTALLRQSASILKANPGERTPTELDASLDSMYGVAERAEDLAADIEGRVG